MIMTHKTDGKYIIVDVEHLMFVDFSYVEESGSDSIRYSIDEKKFILKYMDEQPDFVYLITGDSIGLPEYTHSEIREIVNGPPWKLNSYQIVSTKPSAFDERPIREESRVKVLNDQSRRYP